MIRLSPTVAAFALTPRDRAFLVKDGLIKLPVKQRHGNAGPALQPRIAPLATRQRNSAGRLSHS